MRPLHGPAARLMLLATHVQIIFGNLAPDLVKCTPSSACLPPVATTSPVTTITIESTLTHSCYTQTLTTKRLAGASGCPTLTNCGPHPDCIIVSTQTVKLPPKDALCTSTPTTLVPGPCPTCQTGCDVLISTVSIISTPALQTPLPTPPAILQYRQPEAEAEPQAAPTCYTTVINSDPIPTGVTKTVFPVTATKTSLLSCKGCGIVTKFLNGFGPASQYKVTTTAAGKTTTVLAYSCRQFAAKGSWSKQRDAEMYALNFRLEELLPP
ncbi:hypothetical protein VTL71DRAFT_13797 [Oculimacula yallundae]|uniref:Uncharacterized protein n=1 Tax=Oculimacula yallundae TaxID=86028 RepID=A0ABR4CNJ3_9HELO